MDRWIVCARIKFVKVIMNDRKLARGSAVTSAASFPASTAPSIDLRVRTRRERERENVVTKTDRQTY